MWGRGGEPTRKAKARQIAESGFAGIIFVFLSNEWSGAYTEPKCRSQPVIAKNFCVALATQKS